MVKTYSGHPAINDIEYGIIHDYHGIKRFFTMVEPKKYGVRPLLPRLITSGYSVIHPFRAQLIQCTDGTGDGIQRSGNGW